MRVENFADFVWRVAVGSKQTGQQRRRALCLPHAVPSGIHPHLRLLGMMILVILNPYWIAFCPSRGR